MPDLTHFIEQIKNGGVVAFPTETVYGLGADAKNASAVKKVFELKGRPADNPLIVHVASIDEINDFAAEVPPQAIKLMDSFWPGPLTLVFKKKSRVLDIITAGLDSVAIRMPDHKIAAEFISRTGPLVAPSANKSGRPSPTKAEHVRHDFGLNFPVIDGGATEIGLESTVLDLTGNVPSILRPGKIGAEEIQKTAGIKVAAHQEYPVEKPKSPGQKYSHYKPEARIYYGGISGFEEHVLYLLQNESHPNKKNIISYNGNLERLSHDLYDRFRQADLEGYDAVYIEEIESLQAQFPSLYSALRNRILKAIGHA